MSIRATTPLVAANPNSTAGTAQQEPGPIERALLKVVDFMKKIFQKISEFFSKLFNQNATQQTSAAVSSPAPAATVAETLPSVTSENLSDPESPIPVPVRNILKDLRQWRSPQDLLNRFDREVPEDQRNEIYERFGRNYPLGSYDDAMNRIWRSQADAVNRYIQIGKEHVMRNPRVLIHEITALYPGN